MTDAPVRFDVMVFDLTLCFCNHDRIIDQKTSKSQSMKLFSAMTFLFNFHKNLQVENKVVKKFPMRLIKSVDRPFDS